jgi:Amt family ammonium transporter
MDWTAFGNGVGTHQPSAAGDRHGEPDLAQHDQQKTFHSEEPNSDSADEKVPELPQADATTL